MKKTWLGSAESRLPTWFITQQSYPNHRLLPVWLTYPLSTSLQDNDINFHIKREFISMLRSLRFNAPNTATRLTWGEEQIQFEVDKMRCAKLELTVLLGVGIFLAGSISLITITMQKIFPAREEQTFKEINCTIVSGDMNATTKCSNKNQEGSYPCLRIYVLCGKDKIKENPSLESTQPRLLRKDFYSLQKQVRTSTDLSVFIRIVFNYENRFLFVAKMISIK